MLFASTIAGLLTAISWNSQPEQGSKPRSLSSEIYVWQRQRSEALDHSLRKLADDPFAKTVHVLAAEAHWRDGRLRIQRFVQPAIPANLHVGHVLRLGSSLARCDWEDATVADLSACVAELAETSGVEVQIDYDCPQSRLMDYADFLRKLRPHVKGKRLCITALPCWLNEPAFLHLASLADDYVLQVHSLHLPESADSLVTLIDPGEARTAASQASALGLPFRLALPTYGCAVYFNKDDGVTDVISEDRSDTPINSRGQLGYSDPAVIAPLVAEWLESPPLHLKGLVWFRLPTTDDTRNWSLDTLARVARGMPVAERLRTECIERAPGTFDVIITNKGNIDAHLTGTVRLDRSVAFADGTGGYVWQPDGVFTLTKHDWPWLRPQESTTIGWLRTVEAITEPPFASIK